MSRAAELIDRFEKRRPQAVRLAEAVSLAVLVDPLLLRRARRHFVPEADAGTEADLWLSPLVRTRSPDGIVFSPEVAEELRQRLQKSGRLEEAWNFTKELHGHLPPALQLEEEIAWLSASQNPSTADRIEELLQSALAALVSGERRGLAHWAAQALPRLPSGVRVRGTARMLEAGAHLRLGGNARPLSAGETTPDWSSWVVPADLARVPVRVRLLAGAVELDSKTAEGNLLQLPQTDPLVVDLIWDDPDEGGERAVQITFRKGEVVTAKVPTREVRLRTILGEVYDLWAAGTPAREVRDWMIDFSELRARPEHFFGRERDLAWLEDLIKEIAGSGRESGILVSGGLGVGKTALLSEFLSRREKKNEIVPHHFFRLRRERWEDIGAAERSLAAQLVTRFPSLLPRVSHLSLLELLQQLPSEDSRRPLVLVIDALDEALERDRLREILPKLPIPGVVFIVSAQTDDLQHFEIEAPLRYLELSNPDEDLEEYWSYYAPSLDLVREAIQEAVRLSAKSFGVAEVLRRWIASRARRPRSLVEPMTKSGQVSGGVLEELWEEATSRQKETPLLFGLLTAARGPLPLSVLDGIISQPTLTLLAPFEFLPEEVWMVDGPAFEWKEEVIRDFVAGQVSLSLHHKQLAEFLAAGLERGNLAPGDRAYAVRNVLGHSLAGRALDLAFRLGTSSAFLAERCREVGLQRVLRDLKALRDAVRAQEEVEDSARRDLQESGEEERAP